MNTVSCDERGEGGENRENKNPYGVDVPACGSLRVY